MRYDQEWLMFEAERLLQPDGTVRLPVDMDRTLRDLAGESGPLMYILACCAGIKRSLTAQMLMSHMTTDESIRKAIGIQGQISGVDLIVQNIVDLMQKPADAQAAEATFDFMAKMAGVSPADGETFHG